MSKDAGTRTDSDAERMARIRLARTEGVGPITFRRLIERHGSAVAIVDRLPELLRAAGRPVARVGGEAAAAEVAAIARLGGRLIVIGEADYPPPLAAIDDPPPVLAVVGDPAVLSRPAVAVVGSRNASLNGRRFAESLARDLGQAGCVVVSGLARGIDTAAHRGALATGTVAVVAGGVDVVYPPENRDLHREIAVLGAIVSEMPVGVVPQARHFPRRNRIISGLAQAVVVVEANERSGSLITARMALEQGREVCAVPGSPLDGRARGCNDLLRHGAALVEGANDVLSVIFGPGVGAPVRRLRLPSAEHGAEAPGPFTASLADDGPDADGSGDARATIRALLSPTPVSVDDVLRMCHLPPATVNTILLEWELAGRLERHPGNRVSLVVTPSGA